MRILHYMQAIDFRHGGPPRAVVDQVATMHARGHEAGVATTSVEDVPEAWLTGAPGSPEVVRLPAVAGLLNRLTADGVRRVEEAARRYDVVHLHGVWETSNLQVAGACRAAGTPYVVSLRGMLDDWAMRQKPLKKKLYLALGGRRFLEGAAAVHCTAEYEKQQSQGRFGTAKSAVIPNLVDLRSFADVPDPAPARAEWPAIDGSGLTILFLSRLHPGKGVDMLIDSVAEIRRGGCDVHLVIAGNGEHDYEQTLRRRAEAAGIQDHVTWTGFISGDVKLSLFAAADVFALPTMQENFGFVMFEALAAGTPVVSSNLVDTRDEISASGGGVVVERTVDAFVEGLKGFADGTRDPKAMGAAGRRWTLEHLSADRVAGAFEKLYESFLDPD
ncbi:MAG: glycosyltransferase [Phycisphaera sp.]|nr:glycosyltransferase [Phycisphaera sp.]